MIALYKFALPNAGFEGGNAMKLMFLGATHEVTGSCFYLEACGKRMLVDCGMEQGPDMYVNQEIPVLPAEVDYVLLTHAHIDHSGRLPLLYKNGFQGEVHATRATHELCEIMLRDSAHIQMFEAEWRNRKAKRSGGEETVPLYDMNDADGVLACFEPHAYRTEFTLCEGVRVRFVDVGHLLGSASIEVWLTENGVTKKLVFSGDIGNKNQPLIKNPEYIAQADYVVMESTYGDRTHGEAPDYVSALAKLIQTTFQRGGNLVIPSFAVGRTQELLYFMRKIKADGLVRGYDNFEVYIDSPLAVEATNIFHENVSDCFDDEALELVRKGINPIAFPGLKVSVTSDDSKAINFDRRSKVIISASGMCDAGRIRHHLKHNLWRAESTVLFVGYQAVGTLGRALLEGAKSVKLFGEEIEVKADIQRLNGVSGHADKNGLLEWVGAFSPKPAQVFVVHGESSVCDAFTDCLRTEHGLTASAPYSGTEFDLAAGAFVVQAQPVRVEKPVAGLAPRVSDVFTRLLGAGKRLLAVISRNEGCPNKELAKFADQINSLCEKWDR